jgi:Fe-S-cluster containining protein
MDAAEEDIYECLQCGWCCKQFTGIAWAAPPDLLRWYDEGRRDILQYALVSLKDGTRISAAELNRDELEAVPGFGRWRDPVSGDILTQCPFLAQITVDTYICTIHETKPHVCRGHSPREWEMYGHIETPCRATVQRRDIRGE